MGLRKKKNVKLSWWGDGRKWITRGNGGEMNGNEKIEKKIIFSFFFCFLEAKLKGSGRGGGGGERELKLNWSDRVNYIFEW